ncbi:MAG: RNA methyltransferase [Bacteroidetes bacterium]|nr:RNA methyltransferase [Bacteroidota bacterium]
MRKLRNEELGRLTVGDFKKKRKIPFVVVLDNVRSLNNIGSVFRTSDAFVIEEICLCGITGSPPNKEITKTALGATESVAWKYYETTEEIITKLKSKGYTIISIEQAENSISLKDFTVYKNLKYAIVFGHEINGVGQNIVNLSDYCIEIPQFGTKHSFNVAVSAGIILWELFNKWEAVVGSRK